MLVPWIYTLVKPLWMECIELGLPLAVLWETESYDFQGQCTHFVPEMMNAMFGFMLTAAQQHLLVSTV